MDSMQITTVVFVLLLIASGFSIFTVSQQDVYILERFGKFLRVTHAGLHFKIPIVDVIVGSVNLRVRQLDVQVETKTQDNVFIKSIVSVQYQPIAEKIYDAYYKLDAPAKQIEAYVFDVVRAMVPKLVLDDVFSKKDEIAVGIQHELEDTMSEFGYKIVKALVTDIHPDKNVRDAMNEINTAQRLRVAAQERAEAEKIMRIKQAEAEAEANILHGQGIAGQRKAIVDGLSSSIEELQKSSPDLASRDVMSMILSIQYFDMLRDVGSGAKSNTVFVNNAANSSGDILSQIQQMLFSARDTK